MAQVVADSSCLIHLDRIGQLDLLERLFGEVVVPPAVVREVQPAGLALPQWIRTQGSAAPVPLLVVTRSLGAGEKEAIALAFELKARIILDDLAARRLARELRLELVGTAALLYLAKTRGDVPAVRPLLDALIATGFRLSPAVYREILAGAGEDP